MPGASADEIEWYWKEYGAALGTSRQNFYPHEQLKLLPFVERLLCADDKERLVLATRISEKEFAEGRLHSPEDVIRAVSQSKGLLWAMQFTHGMQPSTCVVDSGDEGDTASLVRFHSRDETEPCSAWVAALDLVGAISVSDRKLLPQALASFETVLRDVATESDPGADSWELVLSMTRRFNVTHDEWSSALALSQGN